MCTKRISHANLGIVKINIANPNLNGTGTIGNVLTAGFNGTEITSITIKALTSTTAGMVRLFIFNGTTTTLYKEISIPQIQSAGMVPTFEQTWNEDLFLQSGYSLRASTQNNESFNVMAVGSDWENCSCDVEDDCDSALRVANTGVVNIATANTFLDGSGTMGIVVTAPTTANFNGTDIEFVTIKSTQSTTQGMVRLFIDTQVSIFLINEIPIPAITQMAQYPAYNFTKFLGLSMPAQYRLKASTQNAESFNIHADSVNWTNCPC